MQMKAVITQGMSVIMLRICGESNSTYTITLRACICLYLDGDQMSRQGFESESFLFIKYKRTSNLS